MKLVYIVILVSLFSLSYVMTGVQGGGGAQVEGMINVCLAYQEGICVMEEMRLVGDIGGLVALNEGSGIANVLGNMVSFRGLINYLGINPNLFNMECSGALVCGDRGESDRLRCSYESNDVCPENYGDWSECTDNPLGGKCTPCDSDCPGGCGPVETIVSNPRYAGNGENLPVSIICKAHGYPNIGNRDNEGRFILDKIIEEEGGIRQERIGQVNVDCVTENDESLCVHTFGATIDGQPCGITENFMCSFYYDDDEIGDGVYGEIGRNINHGMITPYVRITNPSEGDILRENIRLAADVSCSGGGQVSLFRFDLYQGGYICKIYEVEGPVERNEEGVYPYSYSWNTRSCPENNLDIQNGDYRLDAMAIGRNGDRSAVYIDSRGIRIDNLEEREPFKILNLILAKIKTWL